MSVADNEYTPGRNQATLGSSVTDAFYEAVRRWQAQRDSDPNRLDTHELVEQAFASHGLRIGDLAEAAADAEAELAAARAALEFVTRRGLDSAGCPGEDRWGLGHNDVIHVAPYHCEQDGGCPICKVLAQHAAEVPA